MWWLCCEVVDEKAFFPLRGSSSLVEIQYGGRVMPNTHPGAMSHPTISITMDRAAFHKNSTSIVTVRSNLVGQKH